MPDDGMHTLPLYYVTMTKYDDKYSNVHVVYEKDDVSMTMGEVLEKAEKPEVRIAERENTHTLPSFLGGRENPFVGECDLCAVT